MPDIVQDAPSVAPSAAVVAAPVASDPVSRSLDSLSDTDLQAWRATGEFPQVTDAAAASSTAKPAEQAAQTEAVKDKPAASDAVASPTPGADKRIPELLADRARERDRAERAERRLQELEARHTQPRTDAQPAASSPAPAGLVKPNPEAFAYGTADPEYLEALTDFKVASATAKQREEFAEGQRQATAREEAQRVTKAFEEKAAAARAKHADFDAIAMLAPTEIQQGSAADLWVLEDEAGAEILYHLQQPANAAERRRILALGPREQLKELVRLGDRLTADPAVARHTNAPPPPPTLQTRPTPGDDVERAAASGDTGAYIEIANAAEMRRLRR